MSENRLLNQDYRGKETITATCTHSAVMPAATVLKPIMELWALQPWTRDWKESRFIAEVQSYW